MQKKTLSEKSLNLLLRRADWRFLLSNPNPKKSICFAEGTLANAVEYISESVIDSVSEANDCELAVAVNPDQSTLQAAWSALHPGGYFYTEWNVSPFFNPKTIRNKLGSIGFDDIEIYLPKPPPLQSATNYWVPIESPGAINFLVMIGSKYNNKPQHVRLFTALRRHLWSLSPKLYITHPWFSSSFLKEFIVCATARRPKTLSSDISTIKNLDRIQDSNSESLDIKSTILKGVEFMQKNNVMHNKTPEKLFTLMLTEGKHSGNKIIFFVFSGTDHDPVFIVKTTRVEDSVQPLDNEANTLRMLQEYRVDIEGIPKVLFSNHQSGVYIVGESFIEGVFVENILTKKNFRSLALKATDLLVGLANKTQTQLPADWRKRLVNPIVSEYASLYGSVLDPGFIKKTNETLDELTLNQLHCEHRDFSPWNILIMPNGNFGVLDWESSVWFGLPATDLIYFLTYMSVYLEGAHETSNFVECYSNMLDENTFTGNVFKECLTTYTSRVGIPNSNINSLRLITWMIHAPAEYKDMGYVPDDSIRSEMLRNSLFFKLWEHEVNNSGR